jgi:hypothetical protein
MDRMSLKPSWYYLPCINMKVSNAHNRCARAPTVSVAFAATATGNGEDATGDKMNITYEVPHPAWDLLSHKNLQHSAKSYRFYIVEMA